MTQKNIETKFSDIEIKLNRLRSEKAALRDIGKKQNNRLRKARTRTLIQMGGLLKLTSLPSICGINLGDDLQGEHQTKAALLLGILAKCAESIPEKLPENEKQNFETLGYTLLARRKNQSL